MKVHFMYLEGNIEQIVLRAESEEEERHLYQLGLKLQANRGKDKEEKVTVSYNTSVLRSGTPVNPRFDPKKQIPSMALVVVPMEHL